MTDTPTKIDDGGPAHPFSYEGNDFLGSPTTFTHTGMSLRDYFAGQALAGIHAHPETVADIPVANARIAYDQADAMIAARKAN